MEMLQAAFVLLVIVGILVGLWFLFDWAIAQIGPPEPIAKILRIVMVLVVVAAVLFLILPKLMAMFGVSF